MLISDILRAKGAKVVTIEPDVSIQEAMRKLVSHNIGALVVRDGDIHGIITERDLLRAGADNVQRLATENVRDLMTRALITASSQEDIQHVMNVMTERKIRHLPIVDGGELRGIISIGDVVNAMRQSAETENRYLQAYIAGTPL